MPTPFDALLRTRESILNFEIDGRWSTFDFVGLLSAVSNLYVWFTAPGKGATEEDARWALLTLLRGEILDHDGLFSISAMNMPRIASISYASPGGINILGLGECFKQVKEFIQYFIDRDLHRQKLALENATAAFELNKKTMQHLQKVLKDAKRAKLLTDDQAHELSHELLMRELPHLRLIGKNIELKKIVSIQIREVDPTG
ncbi:hypothetical protein ACQR1I_16620 [Bradyrhizobium sp. HKCCYLS2038]|uniref:hypothetical protein n=1 Tax=unclassified Bradyrhizobium TaxID=2631580 RepID=UPI003EB8F5BC